MNSDQQKKCGGQGKYAVIITMKTEQALMACNTAAADDDHVLVMIIIT
jgi:hypothetical protein